MPRPDRSVGVFLSVDTHDQGEIIGLAKKLDDLGFAIFATDETAASVGSLGIDVRTVTVADGRRQNQLRRLHRRVQG